MELLSTRVSESVNNDSQVFHTFEYLRANVQWSDEVFLVVRNKSFFVLLRRSIRIKQILSKPRGDLRNIKTASGASENFFASYLEINEKSGVLWIGLCSENGNDVFRNCSWKIFSVRFLCFISFDHMARNVSVDTRYQNEIFEYRW